MADNFFVSFNSPQCGWMSIGFEGNGREFHTTTAHAPHSNALQELLRILSTLLDKDQGENKFLLKWNRDPEEFDFVFERNGEKVLLEIYEYPTDERTSCEKVFDFEGGVKEIAGAFYSTFAQMKEDIDIDAFEQNWRQPFPEKEFSKFSSLMKT